MFGEDEQLNKAIDARVKLLMPNYLESAAFSQRKLTDTPTDDLQVTPRRYVNMYGTTSQRPIGSVASRGQRFFDTTIGRPVYFNPNSSVWTDGAGSVS